MSDDVIEKAEGLILGLLDEYEGEPTSIFAARLAQALADAGLLPTETEWGVRWPNGRVSLNTDEGSARYNARRIGDPLVARNVTPWKDAS